MTFFAGDVKGIVEKAKTKAAAVFLLSQLENPIRTIEDLQNFQCHVRAAACLAEKNLFAKDFRTLLTTWLAAYKESIKIEVKPFDIQTTVEALAFQISRDPIVTRWNTQLATTGREKARSSDSGQDTYSPLYGDL